MTGASKKQGPKIAKVFRILVVEDEMMIAMLMEDLLKSYGYEVVGPASRVENAIHLVSSEAIDAGILDLNIADEEVYPVADALAARSIPFLFISGYKASVISQTYRDRPLLRKPFSTRLLKPTLQAILG